MIPTVFVVPIEYSAAWQHCTKTTLKTNQTSFVRNKSDLLSFISHMIFQPKNTFFSFSNSLSTYPAFQRNQMQQGIINPYYYTFPIRITETLLDMQIAMTLWCLSDISYNKVKWMKYVEANGTNSSIKGL